MVSIGDLKRTEAKLTQRKQKKESNDGERKKKVNQHKRKIDAIGTCAFEN